MGELEENEMAPATNGTKETSSPSAADEPKETEKLLGAKAEAAAAAAAAKKPETPKSPSTVTVEIETPPPEKADDSTVKEEIINVPEATSTPAKPPKLSGGEGREVKPKKIPIGGIKMPGFFTKSKPKAEGDGADGELLQNAGNEEKAAAATAEDAAKTDAKPSARPSLMAIIRNNNPFKRGPSADVDEGKICMLTRTFRLLIVFIYRKKRRSSGHKGRRILSQKITSDSSTSRR